MLDTMASHHGVHGCREQTNNDVGVGDCLIESIAVGDVEAGRGDILASSGERVCFGKVIACC